MLRKDRDKNFRKKIFDSFNNECCFKSNMVKSWAKNKYLTDEEMDIKCTNSDILKIYRKDGNIENNESENILVACPFHYGVLYNELRLKIKKAKDSREGIRKETKVTVILTNEEFEKF